MLTLQVKSVDPVGEWSVDLPEEALTDQLKSAIEQLTTISVAQQKLLCVGKYLKDGETLAGQKIKPNAKIIVMKIPDSQAIVATKAAAEEAKEEVSRVQKVVEAAAQVATRRDGGADRYEQYYFELQNQDGTPVDLPAEHRQNIMSGMALHEKGKAELAKGQYRDALEFLLESDARFQASPQYIRIIDNYGLLCLDIVWAYFKLQDMHALRDAQTRLLRARRSLEQVHGKNMAKLFDLKSDSYGNAQRQVYARLAALEGVVAFLDGNANLAYDKLQKAHDDIRALDIPEEGLMTLLSMGFDERESRRALVACGMQTEHAVNWAIKRREDNEIAAQRDTARRLRRREQIRIGKTVSGKLVDVDLRDDLVAKGFDKLLVEEAVRQADNNSELASQMLNTDIDLLIHLVTTRQQDEERRREQRAAKDRAVTESDQQLQLVDIAAPALPAMTEEQRQAARAALQGVFAQLPAVAQDAPQDAHADDADDAASADEQESEDSAEDELAEAFSRSHDPDSYLDIDLSEPARIVQQYLGMLLTQQ
eukprot:TRINITY_DN1481_c0_g2_i1.p1 TRINITY_DN1481_c0_g2~~TRINITY_DN1481_c0_g2_i1.p1  ORF type:complete len:537 (-),score=138.96 TRINITY_DN1481_c0_g2_i1:682-2292(-)